MCVCQSVRPVPESAFRSVCAAERSQRGPAPAPAGPASRYVCSVSAAAHSWICVIVYCQNHQMFQTRCSVWSLLAESETRVIKAVETGPCGSSDVFSFILRAGSPASSHSPVCRRCAVLPSPVGTTPVRRCAVMATVLHVLAPSAGRVHAERPVSAHANTHRFSRRATVF